MRLVRLDDDDDDDDDDDYIFIRVNYEKNTIKNQKVTWHRDGEFRLMFL